jgi:hypothetical protein
MNHKRNRTREEKIIDCLDNNINNLDPTLREILFKELQSTTINSVDKMTKYIRNKLKIPSIGSQTKEYWIVRGWSDSEAKFKASQKYSSKNRNYVSPYSREFWVNKINLKTNEYYTIQEADFERNSRRPIKKEYWISKGYSEEDAILKANETKNKNNKSGNKSTLNRSKEQRKYSSHRCKEYWLLRGYTEEDADRKVSQSQKTFSLDVCIKKYGEEEGEKRWLDRQEKW